MKTTRKYLSEICTRQNITSIARLGEMLGISRQAAHEQMNGNSAMKPLVALRAALLLDISPCEVIAATQAEQAKTAKEKAEWEKLYELITETKNQNPVCRG